MNVVINFVCQILEVQILQVCIYIIECVCVAILYNACREQPKEHGTLS